MPSRIDTIIEWYEENEPENFNLDFVYSVDRFYREAGFITLSQGKALQNIIEGFEVEE